MTHKLNYNPRKGFTGFVDAEWECTWNEKMTDWENNNPTTYMDTLRFVHYCRLLALKHNKEKSEEVRDHTILLLLLLIITIIIL